MLELLIKEEEKTPYSKCGLVEGPKVLNTKEDPAEAINPATGEQESEVRLASRSDLDSAVEVAKKAFETWSLKPALQRARIIFKFKELIEKNSTVH